MTERDRIRAIIQVWNPSVLDFMDAMREEFDGDVRVTKLFCEVTNAKPLQKRKQLEKNSHCLAE